MASSTAALPQKIREFVDEAKALCKPNNVHLCTGSKEENEKLVDELIKAGTLIKLNQDKRPGCYAAFTDPADVARAEKDTFICSANESDSGPTNNWVHPDTKKQELKKLFNGCMEGRTMYVVPFIMGPAQSPFSKVGVQITDSAYVAANMRIMTRMGTIALDHYSKLEKPEFVPCMHSVGRPIVDGDPKSEAYISARSAWPCNIAKRNVCHFPETREIWSFGSGYGGNSLLGKKCFALRIASVQARDEGWLAEHMLILGLTNPEGKKRYVAAAFPSACGKTNLAMMLPSLPGWKVEVVGDDIAWLKPSREDGRLYAINPEFGFFGVAPGTSQSTNPNAMATIAKNSMFTNVGVTEDGDVYWEGMDELPKGVTTNWLRKQHWQPTLRPNFKGPGTGHNGTGYKIDQKIDPCAQPNSRFTTPIEQCPVLDSNWEAPQGVPIDAIIFGGRRKDTIPLVYEAFNWQHGTFIGATMRSKATSASDQTGLVHDPMAMKPFIGYNVKDYFGHWLELGAKEGLKMPKVFQVNWFREVDGKIAWPGFGENSRVLEWIFNRCEGTAGAVESEVGYIPQPGALNLKGLKITPEEMEHVLAVDNGEWRKEAQAMRKYLTQTLMKDDETSVPEGLMDELSALEHRLGMNKHLK